VAKTSKPTDFEKAFKELEQVIERLEKGELSLEESLKDFERGVALTRTCQQALKEAEQKIQTLVQEGGEDVLQRVTDTDA
jgi:exodeoxyribonuclease VII small subunit